MFNKKRGQSTVEYIVLVTAVLGTAILFLNGSNSPFRAKLNETLGGVTNSMGDMGTRLSDSTPLAPANAVSNNVSGITTNLGSNCANGIVAATGACRP